MKGFPVVLGLTAVFLTTANTACRFGNRLERPPSPFSETAYRTEITATRACVAIQNETNPRCADVAVDQIPELFRKVLTSPVWLWNDSSQDLWLLYQKGDLSNYLQIGFDKATDKLSFQGSSKPEALWEVETDPCKEQLQLVENGKIVRNGTETINGVETLGRVDLEISWYRLYDGACETSLQEAADCLQSVSSCKQSTSELNTKAQQAMNYRFAPFLNAGLLTSGELKSLEGSVIWIHSE